MSLEELEICNKLYKDMLETYGLKPDSMGYCSFTNNGNYPQAGEAICVSPYSVCCATSVYANENGIVYYGWKQIKPPYNHIKNISYLSNYTKNSILSLRIFNRRPSI
jgi:hypothetical protein